VPDFPAIGACAPIDIASTPASSTAVTVTAPVSANTKGAWLELIAATAHPAAWVAVNVMTASTDLGVLADIGVGASTAEKVLIPDIYTQCPGSGNSARARYYLFPVKVAVGTRISARYQATTTSVACMVGLHLLPNTFLGGSPVGRVEACGVVTSGDTRLTQVDPGGSINTDTATPVELIASTSFPYQWVCIAVGHSANNTGIAATYLADLMIGAGGSETVLIPDLFFRQDTSIDGPAIVWSFPCSVPAGSRLSMRLRSSDATATTRIHDFAVWGAG
jgi:hypothetical protein